MTLYTKQGRSYRPATESEILSAYGSTMAARRKSKGGGPKPLLDGQERADVRAKYKALTANGCIHIDALQVCAERYRVSTRTVRRILAE